MFSKFSEGARKVLVGAKKEMSLLKHPYIGTEHLLLAILKDKDNVISKKLSTYNLNYKSFKEQLIEVIGFGKEENEWFLYTPLVKKIIEEAIMDSRENNEGEVTAEHLFISMLEEGEGVAIRIMLSMDINLEDLYSYFSNKFRIRKSKKHKKLLIDELGYDMNKKALSKKVDPVIGREEEIQRVIEILCRRTKNNPLLLGEAGVGKSAIVEELSRKIVQKEVPDKLLNKRIVSVAMASLVSGTKYRGEFEERITKLLKEVENDENVIIFIDEIHTLVGAGGAEGAIDASNILKPALARGKIKVIGATTNIEYKKFIEDDRALARRFQPVYIEEPTLEKTINILKELRPIYESFHGVKIDDEILKLIVELSNKYIYDRKQPDKAIDILDEVSSKLSIVKDSKITRLEELKKQLKGITEEKNNNIIKNNFNKASLLREKEKQLEHQINTIEYKSKKQEKSKRVTKKMIADVIEIKAKIPVYELNNDNKEHLLKIETQLKAKVYGQDEAIHKLCQETKKIRLGFKRKRAPSSFLFVGSSGVGKTLLVKEYTGLLYNKDNLIRLDMSEYKEEHSVSKIIGSPPGYVGFENKTSILEEIKNRPHAVILLDEIEKAHNSVINLFLQVLDEGKLKTSNGEVVRFDNNIIIMTSNIGSNIETIGFHKQDNQKVMEKIKERLSIEFVNRIDNIVIFNKLTKKDIEEILNLKIKQIKNLYSNKTSAKIKINKQVYKEILEESAYEIFGARKLDKIIETKIDNIIIDSLLEDKYEINIRTTKS